jgi:hypothetical protein
MYLAKKVSLNSDSLLSQCPSMTVALTVLLTLTLNRIIRQAKVAGLLRDASVSAAGRQVACGPARVLTSD